MSAFLTEPRLKAIAQVVFSSHEIRYTRKLADQPFKPDIYVPAKLLIIEFDGPRHFSSSQVILRDCTLDAWAAQHGISVVHVPYFIQIDARTFPLIFQEFLSSELEEMLLEYKYPHGFIDPRAVLPADYCYLGVQRYYKALTYFQPVASEVINSLCAWVLKGKHPQTVYPAMENGEFMHKIE